jgi:oxaloacetate decarboxylase (Na+ extruding) subunit alpha
MAKVINFIDTTTRDGSQSNWAAGMPVGMMEAVLEDIDKAGFRSLCCPLMQLQFKKVIRDLKEDPWAMVRMFAEKAPRTKKGCILQPSLWPFDIVNFNREAVELFTKKLVDMGALQRVQITGNVMGHKNYHWFVPFLKKLGLEVTFALCYYISPRHTDEYYAEKTRMMVNYGADVLYLKDAGGLLDIDNVRRVYNIMKVNSGSLLTELHSHCTTGLADAVYVEGMKLGCDGFHVAIPPLAEGTAQPSVFNVAENARALGFEVNLDLERLRHVSERLFAMAKEANLPTFGPTRYKVSQYRHRIPGGVISNMTHQLKELKLENRVDEVIEEIIRVCAETGEPHMITPYSQFVCTQAAINVALGERYKIVIDEFIQFALGNYSEDSGYMEMDPNLRDKFLSLPRAKEIAVKTKLQEEEQNKPLSEFRKQFGENLSDEEFLLRYIMNGTKEIEVMRQATKDRPWKTFSCVDSPILDLIQNLGNQPQITQVQVQVQNNTLILKKQSN